jgi:SET domain-containing protein
MFLYSVEVKVATNPAMGMGLFAKEFIAKDSVVWEFIEGIDLKVPIEKINSLNYAQKEHFYKYGWIEKNDENFYYLSCDLTNFINHSYTPNIEAKDTWSVALKDINIGEEIFIDYGVFSNDFDPSEVSL